MTVHLAKGRRTYRYKFFVRKHKYQGNTHAETYAEAVRVEAAVRRSILEPNKRLLPAVTSRKRVLPAVRHAQRTTPMTAIEYAQLVSDQIHAESLRGELPGFIYFVGASRTGPVKIGYTNHVARRVEDLQSSCPTALVILGVIAGSRRIERYLHWAFESAMTKGEWFALTEELQHLLTLIGAFGAYRIDPTPQIPSDPHADVETSVK